MKAHNRTRLISLIAIVTITALTLIIRQRMPNNSATTATEEIWPVMGTFASLKIRDNHPHQMTNAVRITTATFDEVNRLMSVYQPTSEISRLNQSTQFVALAPMNLELLEQTIEIVNKTDGAFDPTLLPVIKLWGFSGGTPLTNLPSQAEITQAMAHTGIDKLEVIDNQARWTESGIALDLGGIAKGFAVDQAYQAVIPTMPIDAIFNLGGNLRVHGNATPDRPWRIGVQHPFDPAAALGTLDLLSGTAVATSGHYERFVEIDGQRYAHIIDPRSGLPVQGMAGVTVISDSATIADALSTALFVAGIEQAASILAHFPNTHALLIPDRQPVEIYASPGMRTLFTPLPEYKTRLTPLP